MVLEEQGQPAVALGQARRRRVRGRAGRLLLPLALCASLAPASGWAQEAGHRHKAQVDKLVEPALEQELLVGVVVGLVDAKGRKQLYGYGRLDAARPGVPGGDTLFEIGSVSKVFTGILLADMVLGKELKLGDPVQSLLPDTVTLPGGAAGISLRHLATHTSGLPRMPDNFKPKEIRNPYADYTADRLYAYLRGVKLEGKTGEKFRYSNLGMGLLGHLLARRAARSYQELLIERICKPLGMKDTTITLSAAQRTRLATPYDRAGARARSWDIPTLAGAGGIRSTANDMLKFLSAHLGLFEIELTASLRFAARPHSALTPKRNVGLGWLVYKDLAAVWHSGETGGYHCFAAFDPRARVGAVVLANQGSDLPDQLGFRLLHLLRGEPYEPLKIRKAIQLEASSLADYAGVYRLAPSFSLTVTVAQGRLMVQATGQSRYRVFASARDRFFYRVVKAELVFVREAGKVVSVVLHQNGRALPGQKVK